VFPNYRVSHSDRTPELAPSSSPSPLRCSGPFFFSLTQEALATSPMVKRANNPKNPNLKRSKLQRWKMDLASFLHGSLPATFLLARFGWNHQPTPMSLPDAGGICMRRNNTVKTHFPFCAAIIFGPSQPYPSFCCCMPIILVINGGDVARGMEIFIQCVSGMHLIHPSALYSSIVPVP